MKKLSKKQGEKLPQDNVPFMKRWRSKGAPSWEGVEDANKGESSFKILIDMMTTSELCMLQVDSTL